MGIILLAFILLVLVISILFGNSLDHLMRNDLAEGFISYNQSGAIASDASYASYSKTNPITKVYDNIYLDKSNAHLIELGPSGESIGKIRVYPRSSTFVDYPVTPSLEVIAQPGSVTSSKEQFLVETIAGTDKYSTIYVAFENNTYLHVIDTNTLKDLVTLRADSSAVLHKSHMVDFTVSDIRNNTELVKSLDDGTYIKSSAVVYGRPVQKLGTTFYYDLSSGSVTQVYLKGANYVDSYLEIYLRPDKKPGEFTMKKVVDKIEPTELGRVVSTDFAVKLYEDDYLRMVQIVDGENTVLVLYYLSNRKIVLHSVYRYKLATSLEEIKTTDNKFGGKMTLDEMTELFLKIMDEYNQQMGKKKKGSGSGLEDIDDSEEYAKWLAYWNTEAGKMRGTSEDYILKTSIIPPICPRCPNCPSCGTAASGDKCTNCGTKTDTSGTKGSSGAGIKESDSELTRLAASTGRGVKEIATGATTGAVSLAKETVGGTVGLAKETVGGAVGLARETVGGTLGLARELGGEVKGIFGKMSPTQVRDIQMGGGRGPQYAGGLERNEYGVPSRGSSYAGSDPYSYNGSLVSKGGNFMPVTADFSRFGR